MAFVGRLVPCPVGHSSAIVVRHRTVRRLHCLADNVTPATRPRRCGGPAPHRPGAWSRLRRPEPRLSAGRQRNRTVHRCSRAGRTESQWSASLRVDGTHHRDAPGFTVLGLGRYKNSVCRRGGATPLQYRTSGVAALESGGGGQRECASLLRNVNRGIVAVKRGAGRPVSRKAPCAARRSWQAC